MYPSIALLVLGALAATYGLLSGWARVRPVPPAGCSWVWRFRRLVLGSALIALGAAWLWHLGGLLAFTLVVGGEELFESTVIIGALRLGQEFDAGHARPPDRP